MSGKRYPEEFKIEAVKQVVDRGYSVASVATRLDITTHSLYSWIKKYGPDSSTNKEQSDAQAEIRRLQKELKRVTDERDILKKAVVDSIGQRAYSALFDHGLASKSDQRFASIRSTG
ncbi:transposase, partial [Escherichia coli]